MPSIKLTRIKQKFGRNQLIKLTVGGKECTLRNGDQEQVKLPDGQHAVRVTSGFGKINGTVILPAHKEVEVGFNVSDTTLTRRLILISLIGISVIGMVWIFDMTWAFVLLFVAMIPSIITNRKALYVDVIGEEIIAGDETASLREASPSTGSGTSETGAE